MRRCLKILQFGLLAAGTVPGTLGQNPGSTAQTPAFDVASVRQNRSAGKAQSNIPLGSGDVYGPSGGILSAHTLPLLAYIAFAYKLTDYQQAAVRAKAPDWMLEDKFDIEARTENRDVTKDQMRAMMRSLLAERFKLAAHMEMREVPVFALLPLAPGTLGPKLVRHPADASCQDYSLTLTTAEGKPVSELPDKAPDGFPTFCGGILGVPASAGDRYSFGARNVPMATIAGALSSWGNLGRPVVDQTGLAGKYNFVLEFTPDPPPAYADGVNSGGLSFQEALKRQLGLRLEATKAPVPFLVVEHLERPAEN